MNTATQTTPLAPAADPLAMMDMTPTTEMTQVVQTVAVQSNPQLPVVILSTITKPGSLINISQVPPVELAEVDKLALTLTLLNEQAVTMFGYEMQKQYSDGLSMLLGQSTLGETGLYNFIANDLKLSTDIVQKAIEKFGAKQEDIGIFRKVMRSLPGIGNHVATAEVLLECRKQLTEVFDRMETGIAERQRSIIEKETGIDVLMANIKTYLLLLRRHILAGEKALIVMYDDYAKEIKMLPENPDPMQVADLMMKKNLVIGFEVRLIGLKNAYVKAGTLLPTQFLGIKQASQIVLQNLRDTVTMTIPDLKTSALQLVALNNLQEANAQSQSIRNQATIAAQQAQDLIGQVMVGAKEQQGEALNDAQRLQGLLAQMAAVRQKCDDLDKQNAGKRQEAEQLLIITKQAFDEGERATARKFLELAGNKA